MKNKIQWKKWFTLSLLIIGGGTIFKIYSLRTVFYIPMMDFMGLSNMQLGLMMTVYGVVQTIGLVGAIYLSDRFSKRLMIPCGLIGVGITGLYFCTFPSYPVILVLFGIFALFGEVVYWPVLLKTVRLLGREDEQGRMFGFLEAGRGVVDTIVAFAALGIFAAMGSSLLGLKYAMIFFSIIPIVVGIVTYFFIEDDKIKEYDSSGKKVGKNKATMDGVLRALKMKEIWAVSFNIFAIYTVFCGLINFMPFLRDMYALPATLIGAYGIINSYGLKMIGGPVGGFLVDKKFKSASKYLRVALLIAAGAMVVIIFLPHRSLGPAIGMIVTLGFGAIIFTMRAVFFAPMEEVKVPRDISGAAMSIACFIGYMPSMFFYVIFGWLLDRTPGYGGYVHVFIIMIVFSLIGFVLSSYLCRLIKMKNQEMSAVN